VSIHGRREASSAKGESLMPSRLIRHVYEIVAMLLFASLCVASQIFPSAATVANAMLSVGTSGLASFLFYYLVSERLEHKRRNLIRADARRTYEDAKYNIAVSVLQASRSGGRRDISTDQATIKKVLRPEGFKSLFQGGREGDEGYYAFQNQMDSRTYEYDEIVFNLRIVSRATERLIDSGVVDDPATYRLFVRLGALVDRIERNGPGYEESKPLCAFIWEIFAGWNFSEGDLGCDPVQRAIERL
jgi:hypothetical protein